MEPNYSPTMQMNEDTSIMSVSCIYGESCGGSVQNFFWNVSLTWHIHPSGHIYYINVRQRFRNGCVARHPSRYLSASRSEHPFLFSELFFTVHLRFPSILFTVNSLCGYFSPSPIAQLPKTIASVSTDLQFLSTRPAFPTASLCGFYARRDESILHAQDVRDERKPTIHGVHQHIIPGDERSS